MKAQKKFRRFTLPLIKKVLGNDFQTCWPAIESVLRKDGENYFIGWADDAIENRAAHAEKQKKRIKDYWDRKKAENLPEPIQPNTTEQPKQECGNSLENEIAIENGNAIEIKNKKESISKLEIFGLLFNDEIFVEQLSITHKGKSLNQAFEECYTHHSNAPNPPGTLGEWKQKLNTWLVNTKLNGTSKNGKQTTRDLAAALQERIMQDVIKQQSGGSG